MSEIREMMIETANRLLKDICSKELIMEAEKGIWPTQLWDSLAETGMALIGIPEEAGGVGGDFGDALSLLKVAGKYATPIPIAETLIGNWLLGTSGLEVEGEPITVGPVNKQDNIIFSRMGEGWVVNGKVQYIPWARSVDKMALFGKTEDGNNIVAAINLEDCAMEKNESLAGEPRDEVILHNVFISEAKVKENPPVSEADFWNIGTLTRVALMTGALEKAMELTVEYANERLQFGRAIGKFQAVKQQIAVMAGEIVASGAACEVAISAFENGNLTNEAGMAKIQVGEAATKVTKIAHQIIGAMGFTNEHALHLSTRRLWSWREEYGTESEWSKRIGAEIISNGANDLWPMLTSASTKEQTVSNQQ